MAIDITGDRYGKLLAIRHDHINAAGQSYWLCVCECGNQKTVASKHLRSGRTQSCGCLRRKNNQPTPQKEISK